MVFTHYQKAINAKIVHSNSPAKSKNQFSQICGCGKW